MEDKQYMEYIHTHAQKSNHALTLVWAFLVGGFICCIGQAFRDIFEVALPNWDEGKIAALVSMTMIFLGSFLTAIGVYDKIGMHAGGGSIVPITGFANSVVSPAMEFNKEGIVLGMMAKMFVIAGPIIVAGTVSSVVTGLIYWIVELIK
ncbi:MAG: SpoVA/SpoVAEb family sporulation membrane protein [Clostridia bacterium]|nr:SpoVA/SpoVAEb family sporulation membrane protein [Clostridia bacterium]MDE7328715.1 SpoVA/SpoVAEb family sporulation membrane protein [Clostridia bacterium]